MSDNKLEALSIMIVAQRKMLETFCGIVLGQLNKSSSDNIKNDLRQNAEKIPRDYTGSPVDVDELKQLSDLIQSEINLMIEGVEDIEKQIRDQNQV